MRSAPLTCKSPFDARILMLYKGIGKSPLCFEFGVKICPLSLYYVRRLPYTKTHFSCNEKCWSCYTRRVQGAGKNLQSEFLGSPLGELSSVSETKGGFSKLFISL